MPEERSENELLLEQLAEKDILIEDQQNRLLRAMADFDNFKKRMTVEQENFVQFANENIIKALLPTLDNFERAFKASKSHKDEFIKGIALVKKQLEDVLKKFGVTDIEALGKAYDPHFHEAIMRKDSDEPENTVIEVMQKGYLLNGKLLRPTMVIVSKKGES